MLTSGKLFVAGGLVFTPLMPLVYVRLELVAGVLAESLELLGPQPVSTNVAKTAMAKSETVDFIILF